MPADWKQIRTLLCIENRHSDNLRFAGTYIWWGILSFVTALLKRRARNLKIGKTNRVFGTIFVGFGIIVFIRLAADIL